MAVAAALLALLGACSRLSDPLSGPSATASCAPDRAATTVTGVSADLLPGLTSSELTEHTVRLHTEVPTIPQAPLLSDRAAQIRDQAVADYRVDRPRRFADAELNLTWTLTGVSGSMIGVELVTLQVLGDRSRTLHQDLWYDRAGSRLVDTGALFDDSGWEQARRWTVSDLCTSEAGATVAFRDAFDHPDKNAVAVAFGHDGELRLSTALGPAAERQMATVVIDAQTSTEWLSSLGRAARDSAVHPAADPTPSAQPTSSSTAVAKPTTSPGPTATPTATPTTSPGGHDTQRATSKPTPSTTATSSGPPDCRKLKCVALTFDDGPGDDTHRLLGILAKEQAKATFFVTGRRVDTSPELLAETAKAGHEIGNHSYSHPNLSRLTHQEAQIQVERTSASIARVTGHKPTLLRPPYGATSAGVDQIAARLGMAEVMWDVDTLDWKSLNAREVARAVDRDTLRGSIVLLHDIHPTSVDAVPAVVKELRAHGFTLVTVSELLGPTKPGRRYFRAN